jgi:signal transduction histidine kinase/CheY-like chemotaxis protein/HPt (histidine-containing phosphotransfer) domain-containing protein
MSSASLLRQADRRLSLSRKVAVVVLAAVGTGMIASAAVSVWQQSVQFGEYRREVLRTTAQAFSAAVAGPASRGDPAGVLAAIRAIGEMPDILYAEVRGPSGRPVASLGSAARLVGDASLEGQMSVLDLLLSRTVLVTAPIVHGGRPVGEIILIGGTSGLWARLLESMATTAIGGLIALLVGLVVGWRFQRGITGPLRRLGAAMQRVREHHRYDVTMAEAGDREVGFLIDGFNAMLGDIRERDARLEAHRRNLEQEVSDRTRDLRDARDAAEAANAAKSDFLATMSHEIRTPMNGIMVMAELLANSKMPPQQRRCADVIVNSGQSLLAIINDILDLSKIEAGKLELESVPLSVAQLADTTVSLFAERARSRGVDLAALVDPTTPRTIASDPVRLNQIVGNLVNNALKFTEHGFVQLVICPAKVRPGYLTIAVTDTGVGIPADKLDAIFDAFSQADQSTTRRFGGTGLGLAICKRLVTALGGEIGVTSTPKKGSTFTVTVPMTPVAPFKEGWPQPKLVPGTHVTCILDLAGEATTAVASRYFSASGYEVLHASQALSPQTYESAAVLFATASRLRTIVLPEAYGPKPIVIAVADFGDASAERLVKDRLADAILTKPLLRTEVEALLERIAAGGSLAILDAPATTSAAVSFPGLKVLVADDSVINREVAIAALSRLGAVTHTVESGSQAIAAVQNEPFDIVLMDVSMPDIDGFTATREIRAAEKSGGRKRLPIVALTAHVVGTAADAWRDAGMDDVVFKPYSLDQLRACFQRLLPECSAVAPTAAGANSGDVGPACNAAAGQGDDLLDAGILQECQEIAGDAFVARIYNLYLENAPRARDEVARAVAQGDRDGCSKAAHALKSMSRNVGARQVAESADAIEKHAYEVGAATVEQLQLLSSRLGATLTEIETRLAAGPSSQRKSARQSA